MRSEGVPRLEWVIKKLEVIIFIGFSFLYLLASPFLVGDYFSSSLALTTKNFAPKKLKLFCFHKKLL